MFPNSTLWNTHNIQTSKKLGQPIHISQVTFLDHNGVTRAWSTFCQKNQYGSLLTNIIWYCNMQKIPIISICLLWQFAKTISRLTICQQPKLIPYWMLPKKRFAAPICKKSCLYDNLKKKKLYRVQQICRRSSPGTSLKENIERGLAWAVNISWLAPCSNVWSASPGCYSVLPLCSHKTNKLIMSVRSFGAVRTWVFFTFPPWKIIVTSPTKIRVCAYNLAAGHNVFKNLAAGNNVLSPTHPLRPSAPV